MQYSQTHDQHKSAYNKTSSAYNFSLLMTHAGNSIASKFSTLGVHQKEPAVALSDCLYLQSQHTEIDKLKKT